MITTAVAQNTSLTTLVRVVPVPKPRCTCILGARYRRCVFVRVVQNTTGNSFNGPVAKAYAAAVLAHESLEEFCAISLIDWRMNKTYAEPDYSELGLRSTEAHVLAALLPHAWRVQGVLLDGRLLPVRKFRGGAPTEVEAKMKIERATLNLLHSEETPAQDDVMKEPETAQMKGANGEAASPIKALDDSCSGEAEAEIDLTKLNLGIASAVVMASLIATNSTLLILNLSYNYLGMEGATALASGLKTNSCITVLSLAWNRIRTDGTIAIAQSLHGNTSLTSLNLACNEICGINSFGQGSYRTDGMQALAEALSVCELRCLDVSSNALVGVIGLYNSTMGTYNNEGLGILSDGVAESKVNALVLDGNLIGPTGVGMVAASLARHPSLTSLYLADCNLTNNGIDVTGISALVDCLKHQTELKELNLDGCSIGAAGTKLLCSWLHAQANATAALEHLHVERATNMLDSSDEKLLRAACGNDVMLHLERGSPVYAAGLEKARGLIDKFKSRANNPASDEAAAVAPSTSRASDTYLGLVAERAVEQVKAKPSTPSSLPSSFKQKQVQLPSPPQEPPGSLPGSFKMRAGAARPRSGNPARRLQRKSHEVMSGPGAVLDNFMSKATDGSSRRHRSSDD